MKARVCLTAALVVAAAAGLGVRAADDPSQPPTLVIVGTGINAAIGGAHAKGDQMLYHTLQMFNAGNRGMKPTSVRFEGNDAVFSSSMPTVEDGRITGSRRDELLYPAGSANRDDMQQAARLVAGEASRNPQSILAVDMDLPGINVVLGKAIGTIGGSAANAVRNWLPGANKAYEMTLGATGQPVVEHDFRQAIDAVETSWNRETARGAVFIETAAREFKSRHGAGAKVIVVGHSAFTDAIDQVPMREGGQRLIDMRVLSSERVRPPRERDPEHTVFIAHGHDLPPTRMGNAYSPALRGDLKDQGTIVTVKGYSYVGWEDTKIALAADALSGISSTARLVSTLVNEAQAVSAHTATHLYTSTFDMDVCNGDRCVEHRGKPADVIALQARTALGTGGGDAGGGAEAVIRSLEREKPAESPVGGPVGGISLTKPATLPISPRDVYRIDVDSDRRLTLSLWSGQQLRLPYVDPAALAAAVKCVYGQGRGPELSLEHVTIADRAVYNIRYVCDEIARTALGSLMIEADRALGQVAWGADAGFSPPFDGYQPYAEVALDDRRIDEGTLAGRVWLVPSSIRLVREGESLRITELVQSIRFEFWDPERTEAYLAGADIGVRTPAGDYLAARLTKDLNANPDRYPAIRALRDITAVVGTLLWARSESLAASDNLIAFADGTLSESRPSYSLPYPAEELATEAGVYHVLPVPEQRTVRVEGLRRPAVIFGRDGPTRYLWEDGAESRITYFDQRIMALTSRSGRMTRLLYNANGDLQAIAGPDGKGIAIIPRDGIAVLAAGVSIDVATRRVHVPPDAVLAGEASPAAFLDDRIGQWLAMERANQLEAQWLTFVVPARAAGEDWNATAWTLAALGLIAFVGWRKRDAILARRWRKQLAANRGNTVAAAGRLARSNDPSAAATLSSYVKTAWVTQSAAAIEELERANTPAARSALLSLLSDSSKGDDAMRALDRMDPVWRTWPEATTLAASLQTQLAQDPNRFEAAAALGRLRATTAIDLLIGSLTANGGWASASALARIGTPAIAPLLSLLVEQGDERRASAWRTLNEIPDWAATAEARSVVPLLLGGLQHRYSLIRQDCVRALGRIGDARALQPLLDALGDQKPRVSSEAIDALGTLGDRRAIPALRRLHGSARSLQVAAALATLGEQTPEIVSEVIKQGKTGDAVSALDSLASTDAKVMLEPRVLSAVLGRLDSEDSEVRSKAHETLQSLPARWRTTPTAKAFARNLLERAPAHALYTLRPFGDALVPELVKMLKKEYSWLAIDLLIAFESPAGPPLFRRYLTAFNHDGDRARAMMGAMVAHADIGSLSSLLDATAKDDIASSAIGALETLLARAARSAEVTDLRRAAVLEDRNWLEYIPYTGPCNFEGEYASHRLDFGRVRQLARHELQRRGLPA